MYILAPGDSLGQSVNLQVDDRTGLPDNSLQADFQNLATLVMSIIIEILPQSSKPGSLTHKLTQRQKLYVCR